MRPLLSGVLAIVATVTVAGAPVHAMQRGECVGTFVTASYDEALGCDLTGNHVLTLVNVIGEQCAHFGGRYVRHDVPSVAICLDVDF
jgi:hypothetical protein